MSKMATARIADEIYDQGIQRLADMGMGATDLVRAAFEYVVQTGRLPQVPAAEDAKSRVLSASQRHELACKIAASRLTLNLPPNWDYREEIAEGKWADYEALA